MHVIVHVCALLCFSSILVTQMYMYIQCTMYACIILFVDAMAGL